MTLGDLNTKTLAMTHADTTSYPDATMLIDLNLWYQKIASMIYESQDDSDFDDQRNTNYPIVTTPFILNGTDNLYSARDYSIPVSEQVQKIKRVDITYDGTNWFRATPFDSGVPQYADYKGTAAPALLAVDNNFIQQAPKYDIQYNSIFIYPRATAAQITAGATIQVQWDRSVTPLSKTADYAAVAMSASTSVPGIDLTWQPMIAYGAAYEFANANNLPQLQNIKQDLVDWEARLRAAYGKKDLDMELSLRPAYDSYGDYGSWGGGSFYGR